MLPIRFTYIDDTVYPEEKVYVSILGQFDHHFTGETIYKLRLEGERGWFDEHFYRECYVKNMLKKKVEET